MGGEIQLSGTNIITVQKLQMVNLDSLLSKNLLGNHMKFSTRNNPIQTPQAPVRTPNKRVLTLKVSLAPSCLPPSQVALKKFPILFKCSQPVQKGDFLNSERQG